MRGLLREFALIPPAVRWAVVLVVVSTLPYWLDWAGWI